MKRGSATLQCGPALRCSVDLRIQTYTEPIPLKYGKLATEYPRIYGYFLQCTIFDIRIRIRQRGGVDVGECGKPDCVISAIATSCQHCCSTLLAASRSIRKHLYRYTARRSFLGPFHGAIAVPSVTRCRCCCGHRFYIAIHQVSLLSHAACAIAIAGFGSSCLGSGVDSIDTW